MKGSYNIKVPVLLYFSGWQGAQFKCKSPIPLEHTGPLPAWPWAPALCTLQHEGQTLDFAQPVPSIEG